MSITRLSGGLTPGDGSDPRTFPEIFNDVADLVEAAGSDIDTLEGKNIPAFGTATPSDGQVLTFDSAGSVFVPEDVAGSLEDLTDTSISSPVSGEVLEYDGTNWVNAAGAVGGLVAVKSALKTDIESFGSVAAGDNRAVTDLQITHEVSDPANRLIISAVFGAASSSGDRSEVGIAIYDGTDFIGVGDASSSRTRVASGGRAQSTSDGVVVTMPSLTFVHTPGAGLKTYAVRALNVSVASHTLFINRTRADDNNSLNMRAVSSLVIQEVAV